MSIRRYVPRPGDTLLDLDSWIAAVTDAVNGGGASRASRSFVFNDAHPSTVTTSGGKPTAVLLLAATRPGGAGPVISGGAVTWTWAPTSASGAILVTAIAGLASATDYNVTIEIVGG